MASPGENEREAKEDRRRQSIGRAADGGLESALSLLGIELTGLAYKNRGYDHLIVVKARVDKLPCVSFVGSSSLGEALLKAMRMAHQGKLVWKPDRYVG